MTEITYTLICPDGFIRNQKDPHSNDFLSRLVWRAPKRKEKQGHPFVELSNGKKTADYSLEGRIYRYEYSLFRNIWPFPVSLVAGLFVSPLAVPIGIVLALLFYRTRYTGNRMIWLDGNPTPLDFREPKWKSALDGTAYLLKEINDQDSLERLAKPRRIDWPLVGMALMGGIVGGLVIASLIGVK